ncbi:phosphoribosylamine--glycine ligase [bacterium]|nr:phosphoribosylamine--glycine ligase [bacterium]
MNILIVGGGGREHALAWKIAQSTLCTKLYAAPGNPGIAAHAECVDVLVKAPFRELIEWCRAKAIDLVVVGPERPLSEGIADALIAGGLRVFGPTASAARIESSKSFAKELMQEAGIPTAEARVFTDPDEAHAYVEKHGAPLVVKATGLAEGKGVVVARTNAEAVAAIDSMMRAKAFGEAGAEVLIEEFLVGEEASLLAFADGSVVRAMDSAQDHKPVFDGDEGPNTGGMGAYSPAPVVTPEMYERCVREVLEPCLATLRKRGIDYRGVIYAGLMITKAGPKVVEFNCRFGDPEIQALIPRLENDIVEVMLACIDGRLGEIALKWRDAAVCVVVASGGYPGTYAKGKVIEGLDAVPKNHDVIVFHAGTKSDGGKIVTNGGRVLGVTVKDEYLSVAIERAYQIIKKIKFEGMHYRTDIGRKALDRVKK